MLPPMCIVCNRRRKQLNLRGKRIDEHLMTCKKDAAKFLQAADLRCQQGDPIAKRIIDTISGRDPASIGVKYHNSCFNSFLYGSLKLQKEITGKKLKCSNDDLMFRLGGGRPVGFIMP